MRVNEIGRFCCVKILEPTRRPKDACKCLHGNKSDNKFLRSKNLEAERNFQVMLKADIGKLITIFVFLDNINNDLLRLVGAKVVIILRAIN